MNPFEAFPLYLKVKDVMDATQYGKSTVYELIKEAEKTPGIVHRNGGNGIRIHRDNFFKWYMEKSGMSMAGIGA
jgi:hypothetical protein